MERAPVPRGKALLRGPPAGQGLPEGAPARDRGPVPQARARAPALERPQEAQRVGLQPAEVQPAGARPAAASPVALGPSGQPEEGPRMGKQRHGESRATSECDDAKSSDSISVRVCR